MVIIVTTEQNSSISVWNALLFKHPECCVSPAYTLPCCDTLPLLGMLRLEMFMIRLKLVGFKDALVLRL